MVCAVFMASLDLVIHKSDKSGAISISGENHKSYSEVVSDQKVQDRPGSYRSVNAETLTGRL